jgi:penicillin V acylase-like amidase (Ntn superfamily)
MTDPSASLRFGPVGLRVTWPVLRRKGGNRPDRRTNQHRGDFMKRTVRLGIGAILAIALTAPHTAGACSRAVYFGLEGQTVTGRTMDWFMSDMDTNMWLYPRRLERESNTKTPLSWTSKYGSVVTTIYEGAAADGMNEAGLVANLLYLPQSV